MGVSNSEGRPSIRWRRGRGELQSLASVYSAGNGREEKSLWRGHPLAGECWLFYSQSRKA